MTTSIKVLLVTLIFVHINLSARAQLNIAHEITPISSIQAWIIKVVDLETPEELSKAVTLLRQQGVNTESVIQQLIYYQINVGHIYEGENVGREELSQRSTIANGIIALILDWDNASQKLKPSSAVSLINAILPYLGTKNPQLQKELYQTLKWVDQAGGGGCDFSPYVSFMKSNTNIIYETLISYMYERDANAATVAIARIYGDKEIETLLPTRNKEGPAVALTALANRPEWWAHLYVATVLEKDPFQRTPQLIGILDKDTNSIVRAKVSKLVEEMAPKSEVLPAIE